MSQLLNDSDDVQDLILLKNVCKEYKEHLKFILLLISAKEQTSSSLPLPLLSPSQSPPTSSNLSIQCEIEKKILMHLIDSDRKLSKEEAAEIKTTLVSTCFIF